MQVEYVRRRSLCSDNHHRLFGGRNGDDGAGIVTVAIPAKSTATTMATNLPSREEAD